MTTIPSRPFKAATKSRNAAGKYATVSRYRNPKAGLDAKGRRAWKVPTIEKTFPTSSGLTFLVIKDLNKRKDFFVEDESNLESSSSLVYLNKVVEVASKMANMAPRYSCHSSVQNAMIKQFTKLKSNWMMLGLKYDPVLTDERPFFQWAKYALSLVSIIFLFTLLQRPIKKWLYHEALDGLIRTVQICIEPGVRIRQVLWCICCIV